jgi:hypothetical protein
MKEVVDVIETLRTQLERHKHSGKRGRFYFLDIEVRIDRIAVCQEWRG